MYKFLLFSICLCSWNLPSFGFEYTARLQPEFDVVDVDNYLKNERLFNLQMNCVLFDGPCDSVGRWLKPRVPLALLGTCLLCTPKQERNVNKIIEYMQDTRPELYRAGVAKYVQNSGIQISHNDTEQVDQLEEQVKDNY